MIKNKLYIVLLIVAILGFGIGVSSRLASKANATPANVQIVTTASASTSVAYIGIGTATSTFQFDSAGVYSQSKPISMNGFDSESLGVQFAASSTASNLIIQVQTSNNNIDWYNITVPPGSTSGVGAITLAATSTSYQWTPGVTATSSIVLSLPVTRANHERVVFTATGGAGAVYAEAALKQDSQTP